MLRLLALLVPLLASLVVPLSIGQSDPWWCAAHDPYTKADVVEMLENAAVKYDVPVELLKRRAWEESRWEPYPPLGAVGEFSPMQLHPKYNQAWIGVALRFQVERGAELLAGWWRECGGDEVCAHWAYRSGKVVR